jgi:hypothetical protein
MKRVLPFLLAALMIPSVALAKGPSPKAGDHPNHGKAKVMYVLKGVLCSYQAYMPGQDGSIVLVVRHSNRHGKLLRSDPGTDCTSGTAVTVLVGPKTKIRLKNGVTSNTIAAGDRVAVKVRAQRYAFKGADQQTILDALASQYAHMFSDWGQPAPTS